MKVDASIFERPSFDVHDRLVRVDSSGANPLLTWKLLFGQPNVEGVSGGSTSNIVRGGVDFVVTP